MIKYPSRREFMIRAWGIAAAPMMMSWQERVPRVYKLSQWRDQTLLRRLARAFEFLETAAVESKAPGRYDIDGDRIYATISEIQTKAIESAQFEAHRRYIDVHYLVRGRELIGSAKAADLREKTPYTAETDIAFYERPVRYDRLTFKPGEFTVFFPGQAHMPGCYSDRSELIRKVVVKILAESI
jgi:biofilm protein TabA